VPKFIVDGADIGQIDLFGFDAWKWVVVRDYRAIFDLLMAAGGKADFCSALGTASDLRESRNGCAPCWAVCTAREASPASELCHRDQRHRFVQWSDGRDLAEPDLRQKDGMGGIESYVPQHLIQGQEDWAHRVRALLTKSADVGLTDKDGLSALHYAAHSDYNVEIAQILLEQGADINARDAGGRTPLDHARAAKLVRMPEILAAAGARSGG
jgi:hypothetical protein